MDLETKQFYDGTWPRNVPIQEETRRYVLATVTDAVSITSMPALRSGAPWHRLPTLHLAS